MANTSRYSIRWRQVLHKPLAAIFRMTLKHKVKLLRNDANTRCKPTIYVFTHVFKDDVAAVISCLGRSAHLLAGSKDGIMGTIDGVGIVLNGVIWVHRVDKESRAEAAARIKEVLRNGGDVIMAPEASWNLSPNLLVKKLSWGLLDFAKDTGSNIVPIAVDLVDDCYCVIIGSVFEHAGYPSKEAAIGALRDEMATMVWELYTMKPPAKRDEITENYWLGHIRREHIQAPFLDIAYEDSTTYRPKGEIDLGEVLAELYGLKYASMAEDFEQHRKISQICDNWNKAVCFGTKSRENGKNFTP